MADIIFLGGFIGSLITCVLGTKKQKPIWLIVSAILIVPFSLLIGASNTLAFKIALLLPLVQFGGALAITYRKLLIAKILMALYVFGIALPLFTITINNLDIF